MTVATHLDLRSAHCANMAACSAAFRLFWAGDVMVRVQSSTLSRICVFPSAQSDGLVGSNKSSRQVCEKGNTLI
eukprot:2581388-Prymnesium_polylepis.1